MKNFLIKSILNTLSLLVISHFINGIDIGIWQPALIAGLVLSILNAFLRPILVFITFPINFLTLGLFTFVINAFLLHISAKLVPGFYIDGFTNALFGAVIFSITSFILNTIFKPGPGRKNGRLRFVKPRKREYIDTDAEEINEK